MRGLFGVLVCVATAATGFAAVAQTALQPGLWEVSDKTTLEGVQPMPATSQRICMKAGESSLERLLYPAPDTFAKHGCTFTPGESKPGVFKATTACPAAGELPGVTATAEITYKTDSYEGLGQLLLKDKAGTTIKGSSVLSGKRVGDC